MNFRIPEELDQIVEIAVVVSGAKNRSEFARDCLEAGARREIAEHERQASGHPARQPRAITLLGVGAPYGGGFVETPGRCVHPPTANRTERPDCDYCSLCGAVTRLKN